MKHKVCTQVCHLILLVTVVLLARVENVVAQSPPDLTIIDLVEIEFYDDYTVGFVVKVINLGERMSREVPVRAGVRVSPELVEELGIGLIETEAMIPILGKNERARFEFDFFVSPEVIEQTGIRQLIWAEVDPENQIYELDEQNNVLEREIDFPGGRREPEPEDEDNIQVEHVEPVEFKAGGTYNLVILGVGFRDNSKIELLNDEVWVSGDITFNSENRLTAQIEFSDAARSGTYTIRVSNPGSGLEVDFRVEFTIEVPPPPVDTSPSDSSEPDSSSSDPQSSEGTVSAPQPPNEFPWGWTLVIVGGVGGWILLKAILRGSKPPVTGPAPSKPTSDPQQKSPDKVRECIEGTTRVKITAKIEPRRWKVKNSKGGMEYIVYNADEGQAITYTAGKELVAEIKKLIKVFRDRKTREAKKRKQLEQATGMVVAHMQGIWSKPFHASYPIQLKLILVGSTADIKIQPQFCQNGKWTDAPAKAKTDLTSELVYKFGQVDSLSGVWSILSELAEEMAQTQNRLSISSE